jgi:hypothetical protein
MRFGSIASIGIGLSIRSDELPRWRDACRHGAPSTAPAIRLRRQRRRRCLERKSPLDAFVIERAFERVAWQVV